MVIAARSYLDLGYVKVNLRTDENCPTLTYLDLAIAFLLFLKSSGHCSIKHRDGISISKNIRKYGEA